MSRISLAQIEAFYWVCELGSVQKAADRLGVAQPTVSLRLRLLEVELGGPVLERHGRGIKLTPVGHHFRAQAQAVMLAYRAMERGTAGSGLSGAVRIGLAEGFATACLPHLVPALVQIFPALRPEWTVTTSASLESALVDGNLDLAVLVDAVGHRDLRLQPLGLQPNVWAAAPILKLPAITGPADLVQVTVVTTPAPTSMYRNTVAWFAAGGLQPGSLCVCTSVNVAAQLVAAGIGIGIFPARLIETYSGTGRLMPLATDPPLGAGHVFVADRVTADPTHTAAIVGVLKAVTSAIGYFGVSWQVLELSPQL
jgi:DNA-binding transcriptional LysR family regulator